MIRRPASTPPMRFIVGGTRYCVCIPDEPLANAGGNPVNGLWEWSTRTIWLSGDTDPANRLEVLLHELWHAWRHHYGKPVDEEAECNNAAAFFLEITRQLARQGGEAALRRMEPIRAEHDCGHLSIEKIS